MKKAFPPHMGGKKSSPGQGGRGPTGYPGTIFFNFEHYTRENTLDVAHRRREHFKIWYGPDPVISDPNI